MLLKDKVVVLTGSNRGIGKSVLKLFHSEGANIFACARVQTPEFEVALKEQSKYGEGFIQPIYFDLRNSVEIKRLYKKLFFTQRKLMY